MADAQSHSSSEKEIQDPHSHVNLDLKASSLATSDLEAGPVADKLQPKNINGTEINWETDDDPSNPLNWSPSRKWQNLGVISIMSLTTYISTLFFSSSPANGLLDN
jgi:hypothetical protein